MTLDDLSKLLEAHEKLYQACMWIDHGHPPSSIRPELAEVQRIKTEIARPQPTTNDETRG